MKAAFRVATALAAISVYLLVTGVQEMARR
jgi:hypothetical protein